MATERELLLPGFAWSVHGCATLSIASPSGLAEGSLGFDFWTPEMLRVALLLVSDLG